MDEPRRDPTRWIYCALCRRRHPLGIVCDAVLRPSKCEPEEPPLRSTATPEDSHGSATEGGESTRRPA